MPQFLVVTRPERSSDDIAADRKAANAFFARYQDTDAWFTRQDLDRLIRFYSHDWNLICCAMEGSAWSLSYGRESAARRAVERAERTARAVAQEIPARDDSQLRAYVHATTTKRMRPPGVALIPVGERLTTRGQAKRFWGLCQNPTPRFRAAVMNDDVPFSQWLLLHPGYGPQYDAPEGYAGTLRLPKSERFVRGSVRPAGMSYDRALELASAFLDQSGR